MRGQDGAVGRCAAFFLALRVYGLPLNSNFRTSPKLLVDDLKNRAPPARGTRGGSPTPGGCFRETSRVVDFTSCGYMYTSHDQPCGFWHAPASTLQPRATARIGSTTETTYARNAIAIGSRRAERLQNRLAAHWPTHARRGCSKSATRRRRSRWPTRQAAASRAKR